MSTRNAYNLELLRRAYDAFLPKHAAFVPVASSRCFHGRMRCHWITGTDRPAGGRRIHTAGDRKTIEREFAGGQSHDYHFTLEAGEYAKLLVEPVSIFVAIAVFGPDGKQLFEVNIPTVLSIPSVE